MQAAFDKHDVSTLSSFYTKTSVVNWYGETNGLGGVYNGVGNIQLLYAASIGSTTSLALNFSNIQTSTVGPSEVNATSNVSMLGVSSVVGNMTATIKVSQEWVLSGTSWSIQKEDWNYTVFNVSNPSEATVFPQWGLSLSGHNPNLSDMHVIEWNYAPYVAAAIYIALAAIAAAALWVRRSHARRY